MKPSDLFVDSLCEKLSTNARNMVGFSISQVTRYFEFLTIIIERYKETSAALVENTETLRAYANLRLSNQHLNSARRFTKKVTG